jgi:hypothetical protein
MRLSVTLVLACYMHNVIRYEYIYIFFSEGTSNAGFDGY